MRHSIKKLAAIMAAVLALPAPAAGNVTVYAETEAAATGRYMESEINLPKEGAELCALQQMEDGTLRVVSSGKEAYIWDSKDMGESWEQKTDLAAVLHLEENESYVANAAVAPDGSVFCSVYGADSMTAPDVLQENAMADTEAAGAKEDVYVFKGFFAKILPDGTAKEVPLALPEGSVGRMVTDVKYLENGKIVANLVGANQLFLLDDESGELLLTYNEEDRYNAYYGVAGGRIVMFGDDVQIMDGESGEESTEDEALRENLKAKEENLQLLSTASYPVVMCSGNEEESIYYANDDGLFYYHTGGALVEQLADGKLNSLGKPSVSLKALTALADGSLIATVRDGDLVKLLHFVYDSKVPTVPDTELRVYTLKDNAQVRQAVSVFQTQNPRYFVNLEVGISGDDAVTASDALRTLNTEIMAENGPDVLILDGMPMDSYIEKGVLKDISGIYEELLQEEGLLENIAGIYQKDGAVYAIPSRFGVPLLVGEENIISQITDMDSLTDMAKKLRSENEEADEIVYVFNIYWLQNIFYKAYSPLLLKEDGSLDVQALTAYIDSLKQIFALNRYPEEEREYRMMTENAESYDFADYINFFDMYNGRTKLQLSCVQKGMSFAEITTLCDMSDISYTTAPVSGRKVFYPNTIVGISSRCNENEGAELFVKTLLSKKAQSANQGSGFPVNREALAEELFANAASKALMSISEGTYDEEEASGMELIDICAPEAEEIEAFKEMAAGLDTPSLTDAVMAEMIEEQAGRAILGEISVEEAVSAIEQKMSLYLAE